MSYWRFGAMIATSTIVMFGLMYLNTYAYEHVLWSETRMWMALLMGAAMAVIMLSFMLGMYKSPTINIAIFIIAPLVFALALWLVRSQVTVDDNEYMKAMVPHHSIAIMTSKRAQISDPRVRKLADEIIAAQEREIAEMKYLVEDLEGRGGDAAPLPPQPAPAIVSANEAIGGSNIPTLDPARMNEAEITTALGEGPKCRFHYTSDGDPVFAFVMTGGDVQGLLKVSGNLVLLPGVQNEEGFVFEAQPIRMSLRPLAGSEENEHNGLEKAEGIFEIGDSLRAGYRGYFGCEAAP